MPHPNKRKFRRTARSRNILPTVAPATIVNQMQELAREPYRNLALRGVPLQALNIFMLYVLIRQAATRRRDWDKPGTLEWRKLKRFPERVRQMAEEVQSINSISTLDPARILLPERSPTRRTGRNLAQEIREGAIDRAKLANKFKDLPGVMREYATFLELVTSTIGQIRRHPYNPLHHCLVAFVQFVHQCTKSFMYPDIANLANAIMNMGDGKIAIDPENLRKLYRKNPHLRDGINFS